MKDGVHILIRTDYPKDGAEDENRPNEGNGNVPAYISPIQEKSGADKQGDN
jgi:hypothetical protein